MNEECSLDAYLLQKEVARHLEAGTPMEVIYFGGGMPGMCRQITPLRYSETQEKSRLVALCHRSGMEKTFRLDRMYLPAPPLEDGLNDFRVLTMCLGNTYFIEGMLAQIARLRNLPIEEALASHLDSGGNFESFFDEYPYGGFTLEIQFTSTVIYLSLGYEANDVEVTHYHFMPELEPRLMPEIATHYRLGTSNYPRRNSGRLSDQS